ncbi:hypothetical protein [Caballeronia sp. BR00000012568055]|uniref:hypothetical protein n=1 Tax=Caballeronia sp. BR00000012568055 TaxID=2918761 RepID=UPI0023F61FD2|nr:hypothetical protein [Caballeronia sp. BR00000012568055]
MNQELTLDAPVRYGTSFVEFIGGLDGKQQVFRIDASVFKELLQIQRMDEVSMKTLFTAAPDHFLFVAARKLAEDGPSVTPISLTLTDLLS